MQHQNTQIEVDPAVGAGRNNDRESSGEEPLGRLARRLYAAQCRSRYRAVHSTLHKNLRMRFWIINGLQRVFTFARRHAGKVQRQRGVPVLHQVVQLLKLVLIYRSDPAAYYALNLYEKPHRLEEIEHYIGRLETKNGLYSLMREALPRGRSGTRHSLANKASFSSICKEVGLPHIRVLASGEGGVLTVHDETPGTFDRDLFVKLTTGSGTFGARSYRWLGDGRHAALDGTTFDRQALFKELAESSSWRPLIVNHWLHNHPEIADLAKD